MSCSPAQLAANRANAQKSTGPRTAAGKEASRANAFVHGMAGAGDVVMPGEDGALIARRAAEFAGEYGAAGPIGAVLAQRAAILSVRMERAAEAQEEAVAAQVRAARADWHAGRIADLNAWVRELDAGHDPAQALAEIEAVPDGQVYLLELWRGIGAGVAAEDPLAENRAVAWLGLDEITPSELLARIAAEVARLEEVVAANGPGLAALAAEADRVGRLAWFDPSPEAERARRYESAAERGMYRAVRAIAASRQAQGLEPVGATIAPPVLAPSAPQAMPAPPPSDPAPAPATSAADDWLGSFGATGAGDAILDLATLVEPSAVPIPARKARPDLRKLARKGR